MEISFIEIVRNFVYECVCEKRNQLFTMVIEGKLKIRRDARAPQSTYQV